MRRQRGFTLIELLVVIAIIGILATLVVTQLGAAQIKARNSSAQSDVSEAGKGVELFKSDDTNGSNAVISAYNNPGGSAVAATNTLTAAVCVGNEGFNLTAPQNAFCNVFSGVTSVGAFTYGTKLTKTPTGTTGTYTYTYGTNDSATTKQLSAPTGGAAGKGNDYLIGTNVVNNASYTNYWVINGATSQGNAYPAAPY